MLFLRLKNLASPDGEDPWFVQYYRPVADQMLAQTQPIQPISQQTTEPTKEISDFLGSSLNINPTADFVSTSTPV